MIAAHALCFVRGRGRGARAVLEGIDLCVGSGEFVVLAGPNGCGKSTLLELLSGAAPPASGALRFDGTRMDRFGPAELARRRAWMGQSGPSDLALTCIERVLLGRRPHGPGGPLDLRLARRTLEELEVAHLAHRPMDRLSGGERQRVELARALVQMAGVERALLLLDEPTASLDPAHADLALAAVRRRVDGGAAACVALHDLSLTAAWADRVALLAGGRLVVDGPPGEVLASGYLSRAYGPGLRVVRDPLTGRPIVVAGGPAEARAPYEPGTTITARPAVSGRGSAAS